MLQKFKRTMQISRILLFSEIEVLTINTHILLPCMHTQAVENLSEHCFSQQFCKVNTDAAPLKDIAAASTRDGNAIYHPHAAVCEVHANFFFVIQNIRTYNRIILPL